MTVSDGFLDIVYESDVKLYTSLSLRMTESADFLDIVYESDVKLYTSLTIRRTVLHD